MVTNLFDLVLHASVCKKHASMLHIVIKKSGIMFGQIFQFKDYLDYLRS